ncbi:hypothetical protein GCM10009713_23900 [Brevibacterium celere]|jgi:hypothetical protein
MVSLAEYVSDERTARAVLSVVAADAPHAASRLVHDAAWQPKRRHRTSGRTRASFGDGNSSGNEGCDTQADDRKPTTQ